LGILGPLKLRRQEKAGEENLLSRPFFGPPFKEREVIILRGGLFGNCLGNRKKGFGVNKSFGREGLLLEDF